MSPNLEGQMPDIPEVEPTSDHVQLVLTPLSDLSASTSFSDGNQSLESESNEEVPLDDVVDVMVTAVLRNYIPLEQNLRELLVRVANTDHLESITQIKLRVIAREVALQQLGSYLPALRELILDGSIISSLRDLGNGLRNLKILRVNRCQLTCIDGVFGLENLEELYAADNTIKDLSPCAFLSSLKVIDVRRNSIKEFGSLNFLNLCPDLVHVLLDGNEATERLSAYRRFVARILPTLEKLDGEPLVKDLGDSPVEDVRIEDLEEQEDGTQESENAEVPERVTFEAARIATLPRPNSRSPEEPSGFIVRFPPKVCGNNGTNGKVS